MSYEICVDCYEGPMDLLLDLVSKKKIDIYDISISQITKQYMDTISELNEMNMDIASDFIYMASRLLEISGIVMDFVENKCGKSKYILSPNLSSKRVNKSTMCSF